MIKHYQLIASKIKIMSPDTSGMSSFVQGEASWSNDVCVDWANIMEPRVTFPPAAAVTLYQLLSHNHNPKINLGWSQGNVELKVDDDYFCPP